MLARQARHRTVSAPETPAPLPQVRRRALAGPRARLAVPLMNQARSSSAIVRFSGAGTRGRRGAGHRARGAAAGRGLHQGQRQPHRPDDGADEGVENVKAGIAGPMFPDVPDRNAGAPGNIKLSKPRPCKRPWYLSHQAHR